MLRFQSCEVRFKIQAHQKSYKQGGLALIKRQVLLLYCSLSRDVCCQIEDRLRKAHTGFEHSMQKLEKCYSGRLRKTESHSLSLRKKLAPRIARLALESRSLRDYVMHGETIGLSFKCLLSINVNICRCVYCVCRHTVNIR